ncbi:MAG: VOC family protein [Rhodoplanes sp.]
MSTNVQAIPERYKAATPYLTVDGAARAIEFYKQAFGAVETMRMDGPGGRIMHAEVTIGAAPIMLSDEWPEMGFRSPEAFGGSPVQLYVYVEDVDALADRAVAAGATALRPVGDQFYGDRTVQLKDPFGHLWSFATHIEDVPEDELRRRAEACMAEHAK